MAAMMDRPPAKAGPVVALKRCWNRFDESVVAGNYSKNLIRVIYI
jgi:hypothetical protein